MGPTPILEMARAYGLRPRLWLLIKSIFRSVVVFLDVIVNQVEFQHELITSEQQEQKGYECICLSTTVQRRK